MASYSQLVAISFDSGVTSLQFSPGSPLRNVRQLHVTGIHIKTPTITSAPIARVELTLGATGQCIPAVTNNSISDNALLLPLAGTAAGWNYTDYNAPHDVIWGLDNPLRTVDRINLRLSQFDGSSLTHQGVVLYMRAIIEPNGPPAYGNTVHAAKTHA